MAGSFLDRAKVEAAYVVFSTVFDMSLGKAPTLYKDVAWVMPGVAERVEFKWFGSYPTMKRWIGDRALSKLRGESTSLVTEWWANGLEVDLDDLKSDAKFGMIPARVRMLATAAEGRMDERVAAFYQAGFGGTLGVTYDGQYLFDTDHTAAGNGVGASQSNLQTGALNSANFNAALQKGLGFLDDEGEPIAQTFDFLVTGPANQLAARTLLQQQYQAGGATNIDAGMMPWKIWPRITNTMWWLQSGGEVRPVILGIEVAPEFAAIEGSDSVEVFMRRTNLYGAHMKIGLCYSFWQPVVGSTG